MYSLVVVLEGKGGSLIIVLYGKERGLVVDLRGNGTISSNSLHNYHQFGCYCQAQMLVLVSKL